MKTISIFTITFMVSALIVLSCKNKTKESASEAGSIAQVEAVPESPKGKYAIKSGIVEYKTQMMGMDMKQVLTFDDYGKKEVQEVKMEMMGTEVHSITIFRDGFVYTIDMAKKTGTKKAFYQGAGSGNIDFENLTDEMVREMNLKKEGTENFLGKTCEKISIDYTKMQMKGNFLVYKGVALKNDVDMGTIKMKLVAEKFIENADISADKFEVPADVNITNQ